MHATNIPPEGEFKKIIFRQWMRRREGGGLKYGVWFIDEHLWASVYKSKVPRQILKNEEVFRHENIVTSRICKANIFCTQNNTQANKKQICFNTLI
jgi:hypothetical protein